MNQGVEVFSLFSDFDIDLFKSGKHFRLYENLGAHHIQNENQNGIYFSVWAPNAKKVSVVGNFNGWNPHIHVLNMRWDGSGIWEGLIAGLKLGEIYKYSIETYDGLVLEKSDPFALQTETPPRTASIATTTWYEWKDQSWMDQRWKRNRLDQPFSVYEIHLGSWVRDPDQPERILNYTEIAESLVPYIKEMGFTHVEFMPLMEHPYYPSWGYQITGYFAASSIYGSPQQLMYLIDELHKNDIGVILDWVPSHFPGDTHGLREFDGTALYEHLDPRKGFHPDWKSYIFNYGRNEVRSFLISNAIFWLDRYHIDGLRVDAVASMLYLDYSRNEGEWLPNSYGGNENLEAVHFLKEFNEAVYANYPDVQTIAEESTSWPKVSFPTYDNGLGFGMKWMMGWMHDTLNYFKEDPIYRRYHQDKLTFSAYYAYHEHFMLPLSHDEVVHGKQSLIYKMPGDEWQKFANLRTLYLFMYTFSGAKLLFMGGEFAQTSEWNINQSLDWHLMQFAPHKGMHQLVSRLNHVYKNEPALYEKAFSYEGFEWLETGDQERCVLVYKRKGHEAVNDVLIVLNLTPTVHQNYRIGVPYRKIWEVSINSDALEFGGSGVEIPDLPADAQPWMNQPFSVAFNIPPLSGVVLKQKREQVNKITQLKKNNLKTSKNTSLDTQKAKSTTKSKKVKENNVIKGTKKKTHPHSSKKQSK